MNDIKYPCTMRHGESGAIIKFTAHRNGTVIGEGNAGDGFSLDYHSDSWYMPAFIPYKVQVHKTKG